MQTVIFIPARYPSSRFPGKPLAMLTGATGEARSLIHRSWEAARDVADVDAVYVLTDDQRIAAAAQDFGADVLMTSEAPRNGTERCAEGLTLLDAEPAIVINLQGDAPLTPPHYVEALIDTMRSDASVAMATPVLKTDPDHLARLQNDRKAGRVGATTAVFGRSGDALYFSKEVVPFYDNAPEDAVPVYHHVGCYAYRTDALKDYATLPEGPLEKREGLEQLRFLENGIAVRCVEVDARGRAFWELNNPSDIPLIEEIMQKEGIA
ncbi:MAG: 3-deoxy-manno-octulosonate cytidylyltransferase [Boseongicola sp.]|nr:3-deoxy-manno-octulosonate cytidylyltransferase [Silicimonas sp.]NNF92171.1 3-deoxy-manno-octulosonate cytidylyltransferase [Boseongicola sp.]